MRYLQYLIKQKLLIKYNKCFEFETLYFYFHSNQCGFLVIF